VSYDLPAWKIKQAYGEELEGLTSGQQRPLIKQKLPPGQPSEELSVMALRTKISPPGRVTLIQEQLEMKYLQPSAQHTSPRVGVTQVGKPLKVPGHWISFD